MKRLFFASLLMVGCVHADTVTKIDDKTIQLTKTRQQKIDISLIKRQLDLVNQAISNLPQIQQKESDDLQSRKTELEDILDQASKIGVNPK